jgi:hypothetical protein
MPIRADGRYRHQIQRETPQRSLMLKRGAGSIHPTVTSLVRILPLEFLASRSVWLRAENGGPSRLHRLRMSQARVQRIAKLPVIVLHIVAKAAAINVLRPKWKREGV